MKKLHISVLVFGLLVVLAGALQAQEVGVIAGLDGNAEYNRSGTWTTLKIGDAVHSGDRLRTGKPGRLKVVFRDDSVLNTGDESELTIDRQVFDPDRSSFQTLLHLFHGKVRALVSEYYRAPRASYEIRTGTAVAGVRGTEFIVSIDSGSDETEVIGISGTVEVQSLSEMKRGAVLITSQQITTVRKDQPPAAPRRLDDELFRQHLQGLSNLGTGMGDSLAVNSPIVTGASVALRDRFDSQASGGPRRGGPRSIRQTERTRADGRDASSLVGQPPSVLERLEQNPGDIGIEF